MRVFVTGATGFIGSAVVRELLDAGHEVLGLARSEQAAAAVAAAGAKVHRGDIGDLDSLRRGAAESDGVVHTAFNHDFSVSRLDASAADRLAVEAMAEALVGTDRPIVIASGTGGLSPGHLATEQSVPISDATGRYAVEEMVVSFVARGGGRPWCASHRPSTVAATTASSRCSSTSRGRSACRATRATGRTAGRRFTGSMPPSSSAWPWSRRRRVLACMGLVKKG